MIRVRAFSTCLVLLTLPLPSPADSPRAALPKTPTPVFRPTPAGILVEVAGLDRASLAALERLEPDAARWGKVLAVSVDQGSAGGGERVRMLGTYRIVKDVLRFVPRFPLTRGVRYRAVFDPRALPGGKGLAVETAFTVPRPAVRPTTVIAHVFPSASRLPENQLKFYLHFSAPMSQGGSYQYIHLLDAGGKPVELPFLELDEELWDPTGTRFTLFFDPGRIKRGLKPREEVGPALEEGKRYTLVIDRAWKDAAGNPMKETFRKSFSVTAPDDTPPDVKRWKLTAPAAGTRDPLVVTFPEPMDHALQQRLVWVTGPDGKRLAGNVAVASGETVWRFTPEAAWRDGEYQLVADTRLEDLAGNSIGRPFEVDILRPVERVVKEQTVQVPFRIRGR